MTKIQIKHYKKESAFLVNEKSVYHSFAPKKDARRETVLDFSLGYEMALENMGVPFKRVRTTVSKEAYRPDTLAQLAREAA